MSRRSSSDGALFVGRLSKTCRVRDLEDVFEPYGRMARCEIKYGAEMAYAFVDYEDKRDAEDAIRYENGREVAGSAIIVEWAKGAPRRGGRDVRESSSRSRGNVSSTGMDECYRCHRSGHWARDCPDDRHYGYRRPSKRSPRRSSRRSRSRSYSRERHRSRSGSRDKRRRRKSRSRSRSRSRSYERKQSRSNSRSRSRSRSKSRSKSHSKSRSRSRSVNDKEVNGNKSKSRSKSPQEKNSSP